MKITLEQMLAAIESGTGVFVVINGEVYDFEMGENEK